MDWMTEEPITQKLKRSLGMAKARIPKQLSSDLYDTPLHKNWRPTMAWLYMAICAFDFIVGPVFWSVAQAIAHQTLTPWAPLTLQGGGLFHAAMGAIIGVTAWSRGREKLGLLDYSIKVQEMSNNSQKTEENS